MSKYKYSTFFGWECINEKGDDWLKCKYLLTYESVELARTQIGFFTFIGSILFEFYTFLALSVLVRSGCFKNVVSSSVLFPALVVTAEWTSKRNSRWQYIFQDLCFWEGCHGQFGVQDFRSAWLELRGSQIASCSLESLTGTTSTTLRRDVPVTRRALRHEERWEHATASRGRVGRGRRIDGLKGHDRQVGRDPRCAPVAVNWRKWRPAGRRSSAAVTNYANCHEIWSARPQAETNALGIGRRTDRGTAVDSCKSRVPGNKTSWAGSVRHSVSGG